MFGAAAMSLSSFCVVTNALRLNMQNIYNDKKDRPQKKKQKMNAEHSAVKWSNTEIKEENSMKKTMKIEGMMCTHCEASVKKCLEALSQVESAMVIHQHNVRRVDCHICSCSNGYAHICSGKRRGVINAVSHHCHFTFFL